MIYSYDERKIGNAFGEDLYQQSFLIDRNDETVYIDDTVEFPEVKNFINAEVYVMDSQTPISDSGETNKSPLNTYNSSSQKGLYDLYDYGNDTTHNANMTFTFGTAYTVTDYPYIFVTIQYTKKQTD